MTKISNIRVQEKKIQRSILDDNYSKKYQLHLRAKFISDINFVICDRFLLEFKSKMACIEIEEKFDFSLKKLLIKIK